MCRLLVLLGLVALSGCVARPAVQPAAPSTAPASRLGTIAEKRAAFAEAYDLYRHGNNARALPIFKSLAQQYPELADYHLYFTALIAVRLDRDDEAEAAFSRLVREYPDSVKALSAALELGKLFLRQDHVDQARRFLQSAVAAPDNATAQGGRLALAEADERDGSFRAAYA
jgi:TolA-binding protein